MHDYQQVSWFTRVLSSAGFDTERVTVRGYLLVIVLILSSLERDKQTAMELVGINNTSC